MQKELVKISRVDQLSLKTLLNTKATSRLQWKREEKLREHNKINLMWVLGHYGNGGNEKVDDLLGHRQTKIKVTLKSTMERHTSKNRRDTKSHSKKKSLA